MKEHIKKEEQVQAKEEKITLIRNLLNEGLDIGKVLMFTGLTVD